MHPNPHPACVPHVRLTTSLLLAVALQAAVLFQPVSAANRPTGPRMFSAQDVGRTLGAAKGVLGLPSMLAPNARGDAAGSECFPGTDGDATSFACVYHTVFWHNGDLIDLGVPPGFQTGYLAGMSNKDLIAVNACTGDEYCGGPEPFILAAGAAGGIWYRLLDSKGRDLGGFVSAINARGEIAGESDGPVVWQPQRTVATKLPLLSGFTDGATTAIDRAGDVAGYQYQLDRKGVVRRCRDVVWLARAPIVSLPGGCDGGGRTIHSISLSAWDPGTILVAANIAPQGEKPGGQAQLWVIRRGSSHAVPVAAYDRSVGGPHSTINSVNADGGVAGVDQSGVGQTMTEQGFAGEPDRLSETPALPWGINNTGQVGTSGAILTPRFPTVIFSHALEQPAGSVETGLSQNQFSSASDLISGGLMVIRPPGSSPELSLTIGPGDPVVAKAWDIHVPRDSLSFQVRAGQDLRLASGATMTLASIPQSNASPDLGPGFHLVVDSSDQLNLVFSFPEGRPSPESAPTGIRLSSSHWQHMRIDVVTTRSGRTADVMAGGRVRATLSVGPPNKPLTYPGFGFSLGAIATGGTSGHLYVRDISDSLLPPE